MKKYLVGLIGLAVFGASSLVGQTSRPSGARPCCCRWPAATDLLATAARAAAANWFPSARLAARRRRNGAQVLLQLQRRSAFPA